MNSLGSIITALKQGEIIAYPTEGVWGLGCDPTNEKAISDLIVFKKRSAEKGFILIGSRADQFSRFGDIERYKVKLLTKWPGPHTWLVPANRNISKLITGNSNKVALRLSAHKAVVNLCEEFDGAIISTSANKEGSPVLQTSDEIRKTFPGVKVLEGELGGLEGPSDIQDVLTDEYIRG